MFSIILKGKKKKFKIASKNLVPKTSGLIPEIKKSFYILP